MYSIGSIPTQDNAFSGIHGLTDGCYSKKFRYSSTAAEISEKHSPSIEELNQIEVGLRRINGNRHPDSLPGELGHHTARHSAGYKLLVDVLIVFSGLHKEIGMASPIDKHLGESRRHSVKFSNTDNLLDQIPRMATPHIQLILDIHTIQ